MSKSCDICQGLANFANLRYLPESGKYFKFERFDRSNFFQLIILGNVITSYLIKYMIIYVDITVHLNLDVLFSLD